MVIVGSFDFCYYHYVELHFLDVAHINCPVWFHYPEFSDEGPIWDTDSSIESPHRFAIRTENGLHEIVARSVEAKLGTVFYYDRGVQLQPGERIAKWVKLAKIEPDVN